MVFTRFQDEDEHSEHDQLVKSFRIAVTRRTHEDFQRISAWMEEKNVLSGLSTRRFLDLAKVRGVLRASDAASIATTAGRSCVRQAEVQRKAERSRRGGGGISPPPQPQVISTPQKSLKLYKHFSPTFPPNTTQNVHFLEVEKDYLLCNQGEIGDAFYIIFSGKVRILVDGQVMGELHSGDCFGERSLEKDEPRSATCVASERSQCVVIKSHEYKIMMKMHQATKFKKAMAFLTQQCNILRSWTYPKVFRLSGVLIRRMFSPGEFIVKQGEKSAVMYLIYRGKVAIQKEVVYRSENRWPALNQSYTVACHEKNVALPLKILTVGDFFGEEMALNYETRQYSAVCEETCEGSERSGGGG